MMLIVSVIRMEKNVFIFYFNSWSLINHSYVDIYNAPFWDRGESDRYNIDMSIFTHVHVFECGNKIVLYSINKKLETVQTSWCGVSLYTINVQL
jgi:hypothetical protein